MSERASVHLSLTVLLGVAVFHFYFLSSIDGLSYIFKEVAKGLTKHRKIQFRVCCVQRLFFRNCCGQHLLLAYACCMGSYGYVQRIYW